MPAVLPAPAAGLRARPAASSPSPGVRREGPRSPVRRGLIARVRAEVAAGGYVTEDKLDVSAARLLADLAPA